MEANSYQRRWDKWAYDNQVTLDCSRLWVMNVMNMNVMNIDF